MKKAENFGLKRKLKNLYLGIIDNRRVAELAGERVVFQYLKKHGLLKDLAGKRILEIGPKHCQDSQLLASLTPKELVLLDLPEKNSMIRQFFPELEKKTKTFFYQGNLLYLNQDQMKEMGSFDLIFCLGVIYHNVEQVRLLKKLFDMCNPGGLVVIESATTRNKLLQKLNAVEIFWPETYRNVQTVTHLPSRIAIKSWLEMVGFANVEICDVYSKGIAAHRAVLTARKEIHSKPYVSYSKSGLNPVYGVGAAE